MVFAWYNNYPTASGQVPKKWVDTFLSRTECQRLAEITTFYEPLEVGLPREEGEIL
jgi:hypothetical protein